MNTQNPDYFERIDDNLPINELVPSKSEYLGKNDVPEGGLDLTIRGFRREMVKGDDNVHELKTVVYWMEPDVKKFIVNKVNAELLAHYTGAQTAGQMKGRQVNVFNDPSIMFGNKRTGGLRIRPAQGLGAAPARQPAMTGPNAASSQGLSQMRAPASAPAGFGDPSDDIPF